MLKPCNNKILLKKVKQEKKIILIDANCKEQNDFDIFIEDIGPTVTGDFKVGDKVLLCPASFVMSPAGKEYENFALVSEQDIWAIEK